MKQMKYVVYQDGAFYVSQCLNVDVSSFGKTPEEAVEQLNEAVTLYFQDEKRATRFMTLV